jgi:hypothetical protein
MPFAWTFIYLMNIVTGSGSMERETSVEKTIDASQETGSRAASLGNLKKHLFINLFVNYCLINFLRVMGG